MSARPARPLRRRLAAARRSLAPRLGCQSTQSQERRARKRGRDRLLSEEGLKIKQAQHATSR